MKFWKRWKTRILLFLAVVGPGFITANVDNDAGGIWTYSSAGAQFGHLLLWTMIPITVALVVVQEMTARMGAVTGKGLSDLIREEFGLRVTFFMMIGILITNFGNVVAEFAGVAGSLELFGVSKYISVPVCAVIVWAIMAGPQADLAFEQGAAERTEGVEQGQSHGIAVRSGEAATVGREAPCPGLEQGHQEHEHQPATQGSRQAGEEAQ